jgi:hypothetical protein
VLSQEKKENNKLIVSKNAFCKKVEKREPVGKAKEFPANIGRIYFWTTITGAEKPTKIKHIWYHGEKKMFELKLNVKYKRARIWSYKNILPQWTGKWYVKVVDEHGSELGKFSFVIKE